MNRKKLKNIFLKGITYTAGMVMLISCTAVDSAPAIILPVIGVCMAWLVLFAYANDLM